MDINQFAVYQLKNGPETRQMRFRSYEKLQQSGIQVRYEYYREVLSLIHISEPTRP